MPTSAEPLPQQSSDFDPLAFWIQHKRKIQLLAALLIFGLLAYGIFQFAEKRARDNAASDFAGAKTVDDFRKVIAKHPRSVVAGNAYLMLAQLFRNEGKHDEAIQSLRAFIDNHPDHPLISGAWTSLAFSLEARGKSDEALSTLQKVAATDPTSFAAPVALMAQARIFKDRNETAQAKRIYEQVVSQFGQTDFAREALAELQRLKKNEPAPAAAAAATPAAGQPAPGPAPAVSATTDKPVAPAVEPPAAEGRLEKAAPAPGPTESQAPSPDSAPPPAPK